MKITELIQDLNKAKRNGVKEIEFFDLLTNEGLIIEWSHDGSETTPAALVLTPESKSIQKNNYTLGKGLELTKRT
jgi:hypothetical protein